MKIFISTFLLIFLAEIGDKTQITAMAFSARFKAITVICAVLFATILTNLIAVLTGALIADVLNVEIIKIASFLLFLCFGVWTMVQKENEEKENNKIILNPFFTVSLFFFLSEVGDKTQLTTLTLSMNQNPVLVFFGAVSAMLCANVIGILLGAIISKTFSKNFINRFTGLIFLVIGFIGFWQILFSKFVIINAVLFEVLLVFLTGISILLLNKKI